MTRLATLAALACLGPLPALAQQVIPCDWQASAQNIVEPWEAYSRTFANGAVRLALLDTVEPAAGALHLLLLSPPEDELGGRQCRVVTYDGGIGFANVDFDVMTAGYDPARGLILALPVSIFDTATGLFADRELGLVLNQASGEIIAELRAP